MPECEVEDCENEATATFEIRRWTKKFFLFWIEKVSFSVSLCEDHTKAMRKGLMNRLSELEKSG